MTTQVTGYAAYKRGEELRPIEFNLPTLQAEDVEIDIAYCGLCHSDVHMVDNDWRRSSFPLVPGHEIVGAVSQVGPAVRHLKVGDHVGLGWFSASCMHCDSCMDGAHNLCPDSEETIVGRHGGFADKVRCHSSWAVKLPKEMDLSKTGPLFCGGITVFRPIVMNNILPTAKVGVIGVGGLGHMAIKFLVHWGCEVTAFTSSPDKAESLKEMGVHHVISSVDSEALKGIQGSLDFILNTANATMPWMSYLSALGPKGKFHMVGAPAEPMQVPAFALVGGEKSISGSPLGSPYLVRKMLEFCERHSIYPEVEIFPLSQVNKAIQHLKDGKARFRIVLDVNA